MNHAKLSAVRLGRRTLLGAGASSLGLALVGRADAADSLHIVYANSFPPVSYLEGGAMKGVLVDVLDEVLARRMGLTLRHDGLPWARAQDLVKDDGADAYCTNKTEARAAYCNFGAEPVISMNYVVFYARANPKAEAIRRIMTLDDLSGFSQGDYLGNGFAEINFKALKIDWAPSMEQVFAKIVAGRNDISVAVELVGKWTARKLGLTDQLGILPVSLSPSSEFRLAIRRSFAGNEALLRQFDATFKAALADGTPQAIQAKYV
jgi:polar amino acid transport system substrate-binding protein